MAVRTQSQALVELRGIAAVPPPPAHAPEARSDPPSSAARRTGRPPAPEETMQISLRLPKAWVSKLRREALKASAAEEQTISPQEIVRRLVERGLGING
jgi:hypothetical protein